MSSSDDFRRTIRQGARAGRPTVVVHAGAAPGGTGLRVGFVVSKQVGNAVIRNRVRRRLRHLAAHQLASTPTGVDVVIRALPRAATAPDELATDLATAWSRAVRKAGRA